MKKFIFFILIFSSAFRCFSCEDIDIRKSSPIIHDANMRYQTSTNCEAQTLADQLSHELTKHYGKPFFVSADSISPSFRAQDLMAYIRNSKNNSVCLLNARSLGSGRVSSMELRGVPVGQEEPVRFQSNPPSRDLANTKKIIANSGKNRSFFKNYDSAYNNSNSQKITVKSTSHSSEKCSEELENSRPFKKNSGSFADMIKRLFSGVNRGVRPTNYERRNRSSRQKNQGRKLASRAGGGASQIDDKICDSSQMQKLPKNFHMKNIGFNDIGTQLKNGKVVRVVYNLKNIIDTSKIKTNSKHTSALIGQRNKGGKCQYLIRNSWGTSCHPYQQRPEIECSNGNFWIDSDLLKSAKTSLSIIN